MVPWTLLGSASVPGDAKELRLIQRGVEFSIKIAGGGQLMNSRVHGSEDALAQLACARVAGHSQPHLLIGGLGMGFTLAAALNALGPTANLMVAELIPEVVEWNQGPLGEAAGHPLRDGRVRIHIDDVGRILRKKQKTFDAILLDVDNGPEGLTRKENDWLYSMAGLVAAYEALRPAGVLAVWSAGPDRRFTTRLRKVGFGVEEVVVRAHRPGKGARHTIWLAGK